MNHTNTDISPAYSSLQTQLKFYLTQRLSTGSAIALWKLPNEPYIYLICDDHYLQSNSRFEELSENKGFLFEPFEDGKSGFFLHAESLLKFSWEGEKLEWADEEESLQLMPENETQQFEQHHDNSSIPLHQKPSDGLTPISQESFYQVIEDAIQEIKEGRFSKVVPSRLKLISIPEQLDLISCFLTAANRFPNAMVSLVSIKETGTWLGATPEILVKQDRRGFFHTVALAGTQANQGQNLKDVLWSQKEIEEQALVSRYIINCFKKIRLREFDEIGPKTVVSGNLLHLKTEFKVDTLAERYPQLASVMLKLLHPTSAVCGMPKIEAGQFLRSKEEYPREYYSGYLGPVGIEGETALFVNLRCMQLFKDKIGLYAGAGVTEDSLPEKEWLETEMKMKAMEGLFVIPSN